MINEQAYFAATTLQFIQKARVAAQVRETHLEKNGKKCELTKEVIKKATELEDWLNEKIGDYVKEHPAYPWFSKVKGIGNLNIGKVMSLIRIKPDENDPEKGWAKNVSSLWRHAGIGVVDGKAERQRKGEKLHYNKTLKSMCWRLAKGLIRAKGEYYKYYQEKKKEYERRFREEGKEIISATKLPKDEKGRKTETDEFFALGHLDLMAMRKMIKLFLSHLWLIWRKAEGLPITAPYVHAIKGHSDYRPPEDFMEPEPEQKKQAEAQL